MGLSYSEIVEPANMGLHSENVSAVLSELLKWLDVYLILDGDVLANRCRLVYRDKEMF